MSLKDLVDETRTDKNNVHSYLDLYDELLFSRKHKTKNVLEIGIGPDIPYPYWNQGYLLNSNGGSIKLWKDYFENAHIYTIDIIPIHSIWDGIKNNPKIHIYASQDGYNTDFVKNEFESNNIKFDVILDDGPHTLESMINFIHLYHDLLTEDGIMIIEDVQDIDWIDILTNTTPIELKKYIRVFDRRNIKNRYDDIVFVIDKSFCS